MVSETAGSNTPDDWMGSSVSSLLGSGTGKVDDDNAHVASGVTGTPIGGGGDQQSVMVAALGTDQRLFLTDVDAAFLNDIGYETSLSPVPEPSTGILALAGCGIFLACRRRGR